MMANVTKFDGDEIRNSQDAWKRVDSAVEVRRNKIIINKPMTFTPKELMDLATQALAKGFYGKDPTP